MTMKTLPASPPATEPSPVDSRPAPADLAAPVNQTSPTPSRAIADPLDPEVQRIIDRARHEPGRPSARIAFAFCSLSAVLLWASFTPLDWAPLAWVSLVPLSLLIRSQARPRWLYAIAAICGVMQATVQLQWMRLGHPTMYVAWLALAVYMGLYWPVFAGLSRVAVHRLRLPLVLTVPVVWTGLEYLRGFLMTGFAWYYLGHTQYRWLDLIQISDLTGAWGVSFLVASASAAVAAAMPDAWVARLLRSPSAVATSAAASSVADSSVAPGSTAVSSSPSSFARRAAAAGFAVVLVAMALGYGAWRRNEAQFTAGPRVALVQGNFTTQVKHDPGEAQRIFNEHHRLTGLAVREQPDLIVWPETMYRSPLLSASPDLSDAELEQLSPFPASVWRSSATAQALALLARQSGAAMMIGVDAGTVDAEHGFRHFNSAAFIRPDVGLTGRYDKIHRVPFGEYLPLRDELPWLASLTPFPPDYGIAAGEKPAVFNDGRWSYAPVICFEDTVPQLVRQMMAGAAGSSTTGNDAQKQAAAQPVDCLVNLTNDGWFHGSSELDQHLITSVFRAVECRTPLVRAVNTGISAVIDGDGAILEPEKLIDRDAAERAEMGLLPRTSMRDETTGEFHRQFNGVLIRTVPLDPRTSLYVRWGDWFGNLCLLACGLIVVAGTVLRLRARSKAKTPAHPALA